MKELELYLHIPFCEKKCAYCDFLSMPAERGVQTAYLEQLKKEIRTRGPACREWEVVSIFIGGGTPSLLPGFWIRDLADAVRRAFHVRPGAEFTIECNPGTLTDEKLLSYRRAGVNRLSLGLQSASDRELALLGRIHTYTDFLASYESARRTGFQNINVDLMSGLPGQTLKSWEQTLKKVLMLKPEHISAYSLILEEGTPFYGIYGLDDETRRKGGQPLFLPSEEEERAMYWRTQELLAARGYVRYEISNYAKPGRECAHNIGYWKRREYLGLGLGASSLMNNRRFANESDLDAYLKWDFSHAEVKILPVREQMEEFMFLGLRMSEGISKHEFIENFYYSIDQIYGGVLARLEEQGLIENSTGRVRLSRRGTDLSNYVFSEFLLD